MVMRSKSHEADHRCFYGPLNEKSGDIVRWSGYEEDDIHGTVVLSKHITYTPCGGHDTSTSIRSPPFTCS
ncbi:MAG: hypothetical protein FE78DRAFT_366785 [Acidomyces sp. 'richmondensis']|nr:MAG: hypothetical protein FE78DRAFT_366785 [Acidomyces sp. 'richmondensis']